MAMGLSALIVLMPLLFALGAAWSPITESDPARVWLAIWSAAAVALAIVNLIASFVLWHTINRRVFRALSTASLVAVLTCPFLWAAAGMA